MTGEVLHLQKVAGISGSERHLLSLLPKLRERGWDVRMLMLHENEPGAWEFARELTARGVPLDAIPLRADVDPVAFVRLVGHLMRRRPAILHTHLVHADAYGLPAGTLARVPVRFSTKHGFNEFREAPYFGLADRTVASLAHVHIAISRGTSRTPRASTATASRSSTTGSTPTAWRRPMPRARRRGCSASAG
jgi:hypothetical protein